MAEIQQTGTLSGYAVEACRTEYSAYITGGLDRAVMYMCDDLLNGVPCESDSALPGYLAKKSSGTFAVALST